MALGHNKLKRKIKMKKLLLALALLAPLAVLAQSPATVVGNQPSQQDQIIIATYVGGVWYCN
jgi:uncharacterized membrane protein